MADIVPSIHNQILAIYTTDFDHNLTTIKGACADIIESQWNAEIQSQFTSGEAVVDDFDVSERIIQLSQAAISGIKDSKISSYLEISEPVIKLCEIQLPDEDQVRGLVIADLNDTPFGKWFKAHVLRYSKVWYGEVQGSEDINDHTKIVTEIFDKEFRNITLDDKWEDIGREKFEKAVNFYTSRYLKIEACLPAFPAKSTNTNKVGGILPDKGEELALQRLADIVSLVTKVYPPGIKIWIISDGHVFSDCAGIDDTVVDTYGHHLKQVKNKIISNEFVDFCSLPQILTNGTHKLNASLVEDTEVPHYLDTEIEEDSEFCRKILMAGCHTSDKILRDLIDSKNPAKVALYRGFTRFMEEDLALHRTFVAKGTKKGCMKIAKKCAFEMIKRNEAYSNLVELMFPHHLRLSIHAHCNSGPKFGIKLLSSKECHPIKSLDDESTPSFDDLLHIPTPWHNCIIKVDGEPCFFAAKSQVAHDGIKSGKYEGKWVENEDGTGGYYHLTKSAGRLASSFMEGNLPLLSLRAGRAN